MLVKVVIAIALMIQISYYTISVHGQNLSMPESLSDKRMIVDLKNNTVTLINATNNETISLKNFSTNAGNETTNQNLTSDVGNMTTN